MMPAAEPISDPTPFLGRWSGRRSDVRMPPEERERDTPGKATSQALPVVVDALRMPALAVVVSAVMVGYFDR
jgi:hypothetical protein